MIILCEVKIPIDLSGYNDDVLGTNISVSSNSISLINSHVPIVPLLLVNTLILETSPVAGCKPFISIKAKDSEFSVGTYVGVASYVTEYEEFELSRPSRNLIAEFNYPNDVDYYLREYLDRDFNDDIKRLKQVSRYVDSILR